MYHSLNIEMADDVLAVLGQISRFVEDVNEGNDFPFLFLNFDTVILRIQPQRKKYIRTYWTRNKGGKVWSSAQTSHHFKLFRDYPNSPCYVKEGDFEWSWRGGNALKFGQRW